LFDDDGKIQIEQNVESKAIIGKINLNSKLADVADVRTGIMGFEYWKMAEIVKDAEPNNNYVKLYTNGNFRKYSSTWGEEYVDLYKNKYLKPTIKLDKNYLNQNTIDLFQKKQKIIVRGVSQRLAGIIDFDGSGLLVAVHSVVPTQASWQYLLGLLNSNLLNWYHLQTQYSIRIPQGSLKYPISFYKQLPIPIQDKSNANPISKIEKSVEKIVTAKRANSAADTSALEAKIDRLVYGLYGLTEEEIAIVEGR